MVEVHAFVYERVSVHEGERVCTHVQVIMKEEENILRQASERMQYACESRGQQGYLEEENQ